MKSVLEIEHAGPLVYPERWVELVQLMIERQVDPEELARRIVEGGEYDDD